MMRRKDIDGVIMVQPGRRMLGKLRAEFAFSQDRLFTSEKFFELRFVQDRDAEILGLIEL